MTQQLISVFFDLLRFSLGVSNQFSHSLSEYEWNDVYHIAVKQSLIGVCFSGVCKLAGDFRPPRRLTMRWALDAERIKGLNQKQNETATVLTNKFNQDGFETVVLKGQANALLYPDSQTRQAGDIDILVDGQKKDVANFLAKKGLMKNAIVDGKHIHISSKHFGTSVEIHFKAIDSFSPVACNRILNFLKSEFINKKQSEYGFFVPSISYALVMQLAHIKQHFFSSGIGLRQLVDYYVLLHNSTDVDKKKVSSHLKVCGLLSMAGAVMWLLGHVLLLDKSLMLCEPDEYRGKMLLSSVMNGGNFGKYDCSRKQGTWNRWLSDRLRILKLIRFDANDALWHEIRYWLDTLKMMPYRIKQRRIALSG